MKERKDIDEAFESEMKEAWRQIRQFMEFVNKGKANREDNPQPDYADKFFQYYLTHPNTSSGEKALQGGVYDVGQSG